MTRLALTVFLLLPLLPLEPEDLPRGQIVDPVPCLDDPAQSYALFLPSGYDGQNRCPVLYCFDPGGRGSIPVALFRKGAEEQGWIVVGSNNSRNGPWEAVQQAARAFWRDTHARLAIDDSRVYAAGFSGGARAACGLAKMLSIRLAGVIACGGGLPEWLAPEDIASTPLFGTVGIRDFNYREMQELEKELRRLEAPCHFRVFQGRHSWPPAKLAREAVSWLEARAGGPGGT